MDKPFEVISSPQQQYSALIRVIGVGGGGCNAVNHMVRRGVEGVQFVCANTDVQALSRVEGAEILRLGQQTTGGLGAGAKPEKGQAAAMESRDAISELLRGSNMIFIAAGMGGGTGTGGAPVVAATARELGILTVAVVTRPFSHEGPARAAVAEAGIAQLEETVDSLIVVSNDKLCEIMGEKPVIEAFSSADEVLHGAVRGIAELITVPGHINVDFADVNTVMSEAGTTIMGSGVGRGKDCARDAVENAISSPLLEDNGLENARGLLVNVTAGPDFLMSDMSVIGDRINEIAAEEAKIISGLVVNPSLKQEVRVTVVAAGLRIDGRPQTDAETLRSRPPLQPVPIRGNPDYENFEPPAFIRRQAD